MGVRNVYNPKRVERISRYIDARKAEILAEWTRLARETLPHARRLSRPALLDHMPQLLARLIDWLDHGSGDGRTRRVEEMANVHAIDRLADDFDLRDVVTEYRLMRSIIFRHLVAAGSSGELADLARLNDALDYAIGEAVEQYAAKREGDLRAAEERLRLAVEAAEVGVFDLYPATGKIEWSARSRALFGFAPDDEVSYALFLDRIHPDDRPRVIALATRATDPSGDGDFVSEYRVRLPSGQERWVLGRGKCLFSADGTPTRFVGTNRDITGEKQVDDARERFIAILGHDLRNPLNAVQMSAAAMLRAGDLPERHFESAQRIVRSADRMARMIHDVIDYARRRLGGSTPLARAEVDLAVVCRQAIAELQAAYPARHIVCEESGDLRGLWDEHRIAQVVSNLVGNALHHSAPDTPVHVELRGEEGRVSIRVSNEGAPIPEELVPHLFDAFRSGSEPDVTHGSSGLGLGLFIVREIVKAHGGSVDVQSAGGKVIFTVTFERSPGEPA